MNGTLPKLEEMTDILDIRNPAMWDLRWVWILLGSILIVLLAYLGYRVWRWYKKNRQGPEIPPTPLEKGVGRLEQMIQEKWIEQGRIRDFYFAFSELFRDFLEEELGLNVKEATLEEIKPRLRSLSELSPVEIAEANSLLEIADLAKFAKYVPPQEKVFQSYRACRGWMSRVVENKKRLAEAALQPQKVSG